MCHNASWTRMTAGVIASMLLMSGWVQLASAGSYTVTYVPMPGPPAIDLGFVSYYPPEVLGLTNDGAVIGWMDDSHGIGHVFESKYGITRHKDRLVMLPRGMNRNGDILGYGPLPWYIAIYARPGFGGSSQEVSIAFGPNEEFINPSFPTALNEKGAATLDGSFIPDFWSSGGPIFKGSFLWENGWEMTIVGADLNSHSLNNYGHVVGTRLAGGLEQAFLYRDGTLQTLSILNSTQSRALDINDSGQIVGTYVDSLGRTKGFLYSQGNVATLPFSLYPDSQLKINNKGEVIVVGHSSLATYQGTSLISLSSLGYSAFDLNDRGQVLAYGWVVLSPLGLQVPEPSSLLAMSLGGLVLLGAGLRRHVRSRRAG